ncbi:restriction endonuclease subunit S [Halomonas sp. KM007]
MKNDKQALVPRLRFPEFRDAGQWQENQLADIATLHKGKGISKADIKETGSQPCVRYGELYTVYGDVISEVVSKTDVPPDDLFMSREGDVIIPSSGETKIDIATAACVLRENIALGGDLNVIRSEQNGVFLSYYLNGSLKHEIAKVAQGDTVVHLYKSNLEALKLAIPKVQEQQKIADCLSSLDALISAQADKIDALKTHKKGLMQQLFPREGETVPRLRFPEFRDAGEWIEAFLDDVCDMQSGKFIAAAEISSSFEEGMFPCFGGNGLRGYTKTYNQSGRYSLIGRQGALCGNVNLVEGDFYATEHAVVTTPKSGVSTDWLFYNLTLLNLNRFATGQAQPGLSVEVLDKVPCSIPRDEKEQQKIAECLSSLDALIAAYTEKLDALKELKKGLMQKLFPCPEAT